MIVGAMNIQAMVWSPSPRSRRAIGIGVAAASRSAIVALAEDSLIAGKILPNPFPKRLPPVLPGGAILAVPQDYILPSSLNVVVQSWTSASMASFAVPLSATT